MDWKEFFADEGFSAYRQQLTTLIGRHVYGLVMHMSHKPTDAPELKGALDLAHKIVNMPSTLTNDPKTAAVYQDMAQRDLAAIAGAMVHRRFEGPEE